jgi:hypothetical protein
MSLAQPLRPTKAITLQSSSLAQLVYDRRLAILQVEFRDGTTYQYSGVPIRAYLDLLRAESKGAHFNQHIRRSFSYVELPTVMQAASGQNV